MKLWKKISIGLLCAGFLSQIPFLINRVKTGELAAQIEDQKARTSETSNTDYRDYKGVIHAHSFLGGHSTGTFDEVISGAQKNKLDYVVMTEHVSKHYDTSAMTLRGKNEDVLFVGGNETSTADGDRFLILSGFPGLARISRSGTNLFLSEARSKNKLAFVTYPKSFKSWDADIDGIEVFSLHTNAKSMNPVTFLLDALWSYRSYPGLTLARYFGRPAINLERFDALTKTKRLTLFAGSDAHSNIGLHLGDDSNNKYINFKFDRYETIFKLVRTHILLPKEKDLDQANLLTALKNGNAYIGVDILGDTSGFTFTAQRGNETKILGEEIRLDDEKVLLKSSAPQPSRFVIFKNGEIVYESDTTTEVSFTAKEKGAYRIEVYLDACGAPFDKMPWIISNPIYVR
ncbi:MAG: hypothetical protein HKN25_02005 [Pyrinomonadaceae bacterium]|nr:hypothetical protein [Pyrinomonadaceae bacterium]